MHSIEPFFNWRNLYVASEDELSPFFGREYSEFEYTHKIYNYLIHPQWDFIGSETLYIKVLFVDYQENFAIIELIGEWNDAIGNDIMMLKRDIIDEMLKEGINKYILIGENVLNFHASDESYYEEWFEDVGDGWIAALNFRDHVLKEFTRGNIDSFFVMGGQLNEVSWRTHTPHQLYEAVNNLITKRLD
jgi:hypothetical protein